MNKLLLIILILILTITTASAEWISDSDIVDGLVDIGVHSAPTVFLDGSTLKLISGDLFDGYYWSGSAWISDPSIVSGLVGIDLGTPTVFLDGSTLKLISGERFGTFYGYYWSGSAWISDPSIVSGLVDVGYNSAPTVFLDGGTLKLITGTKDGTFDGYYWSGSAWISDPSIVSGLVDVGVSSNPTVFLDGSTLKLITGELYGTFDGYYWSGSAWISDPSIVSGLGDVGGESKPTVFLDGSTLKLISGEEYGTFSGYNIIILSPIITSYTNSITNNESTTINSQISQDITFDITTDKPITTYNWYKDGVNQNNNNAQLTTSFTSDSHTLTANATNANGTSNTITWNIINPSTITLEVRAQTHPTYYSTFINDADSTGGFISSTGYITLTPTITDSNTYPITVENDFSSDGIKLTFISSDTISSIPLTLTGLKPNKKYSIYESGSLISTFRASSTTYTYTITTHDEISTFELIKRSTGIVIPPPPLITEEDDEEETSIIIIEEELPIELTELILEDPIKTVTTLLKNPVNWLVLLGSYIGLFLGLLLVGKINYPNILLYGTLTWMFSLLVLAIGLNFSLNYIFTSTSTILGFLSYIIYGFLMSIYLEIQGEE